MFNIIRTYTKQLFIIGLGIIVVAAGIIAALGIPLGIDFTGGALTEVSYGQRPVKENLETSLSTLEFEEDLGGYSLRETVSEGGRQGYILRTRNLSDIERKEVQETMLSEGKGARLTRFTSIGPVIGEELKDKALWAIGGILAVIVLFVAFAFRGVSKPVGSWWYGGITILALLHDVIVPTALMCVLGVTIGAEADVLFVMAILAVLGYSVNDTIVVFDRVRENLLNNQKRDRHEQFDVVVGRSVTQTITRSVNTSITTLAALGALYFLGGDITRNFSLILMAGVVAGTYSSIFLANPALIMAAEYLQKKEKAQKVDKKKKK